MRFLFLSNLLLLASYALAANWVMLRRGYRALWVLGIATSLAAWLLSQLQPWIHSYYRGQPSAGFQTVYIAYALLLATLLTQLLAHKRVPAYLRIAVTTLLSWLLADSGYVMF